MNDVKEERTALGKLPPVAGIADVEKRAKIMQLMEELETVTAQKAHLSVLEDESRDELEQLQKELDKPGFRHGWLIFTAQQVKGRKTLDRMALMENGVSAALINASYKVGEPYTRCIFKRLDREDE